MSPTVYNAENVDNHSGASIPLAGVWKHNVYWKKNWRYS